MNKMQEGHDKDYVTDMIETQGFEFTFTFGETFSGVADPEFHRLRNKFILAYKELADYLNFDTTEIALTHPLS
jgi:hypothetical protein